MPLTEPTLLACDLGGTHLRMQLWRGAELLRARRLGSARIDALAPTLAKFAAGIGIDSAAIAVAGPVLGTGSAARALITNLPFAVQARALQTALGTARVTLVNDLVAHAAGVLDPSSPPLIALHGRRLPSVQRGPVLLISAGTGFGSVVARSSPHGLAIAASEAGHADLPASDPQINALCTHLQKHYPPATREKALAASSFERLFHFFAGVPLGRVRGDRNAHILRQRALDPHARQAAALYLRLLARELGNLALTHLALGGIVLSGKVPEELEIELAAPAFFRAFAHRAPLAHVLKTLSIARAIPADFGLLGARALAANLLA